jgi:hypothetical protein
MRFDEDGGLLTYESEGVNRCLGYLMHFPEHGVYDAELGKIEVTPEVAQRHNQVFDGIMVKGLDESCAVGQGGQFYVKGNTVKTWLGTVLAEAKKVRTTLTFARNGKMFTGKVSKGEETAFFERVA